MPILAIQALSWMAVALAGIFGLKIGSSLLGLGDIFVADKGGSQQTPPGDVFSDLVKNPGSIWGLAALTFVGVFLIGSLRGAARDVDTGFDKQVKRLKSGDL